MKHFLVHAIDGKASGEIVCQSRAESRMLFIVKLRALDPFQKLRDVGCERSEELVRQGRDFYRQIQSRGNVMRQCGIYLRDLGS